MGLNTWASLVTDQYERAARLYPALLALLPLLIALMVTSVFSKPLATQLLALSGACGAAYLLANMSRMLGKSHEAKLFEKWGGIPTTQLLRHRNDHIDTHTKQRYHGFLAGKLKIKFPTSEDEYESPSAADEIYRAGVKWLLGMTRDKKRFELLFKENVTYGFHRNCYGLRWLGRVISIISFAWLVIAFKAYDLQTFLTLSAEQITFMVLALSVAMVWFAYFREARVKQAAYAYADMLLRTCDEIR